MFFINLATFLRNLIFQTTLCEWKVTFLFCQLQIRRMRHKLQFMLFHLEVKRVRKRPHLGQAVVEEPEVSSCDAVSFCILRSHPLFFCLHLQNVRGKVKFVRLYKNPFVKMPG